MKEKNKKRIAERTRKRYFERMKDPVELEKYRLKKREGAKRLRLLNPEKFRIRENKRKFLIPLEYKARYLVKNAIAYGKIKREPCIKCGKKSHAHHEDYNKPFDVVWLCQKHHAERHKELRIQSAIDRADKEEI